MKPFPTGEPIYVIPPMEQEPELTLRWDMLAEERDWGHENLGLPALHAAGYEGEGVLTAICDTGVDPDHPDLRDRLDTSKCFDFTGSSNSWRDAHGHGTHCSGIAGASKGKEIGIIGAAPIQALCHMKVLNNSGSGASSWIAAGIRRAADVGADIISLSLGGSQPNTQTRAAIQYAISKGCWVFCAAGNDGGPANSYPGHYPESIAVCATDPGNIRASFSTINGENDISAPGVSILSTLPGNRYGRMSGTSMATPYAAGCAAILRGAIKKSGKPMPSQSALNAAFTQTAQDLGTPGRDSLYGAGLFWTSALILQFAGPPLPPPPPVPPPPPIPIPVGWSGMFPVVNGLIQAPIAAAFPNRRR